MTDKAMAHFAGADAWVEQYFLNSPEDEREEFTPAELEDLARTHRALAQIRLPKTAVVAARNASTTPPYTSRPTTCRTSSAP